MGMVDGKVCLVTGGASNPGLGHAIAHKLADEGAIVIVTDIDGEGAATTAAEIVAAGGRAQAWQQDVTEEAAWDTTMAAIQSEHGRLDALINNAGIAVLKTLPELTLADYNRQMLVNMTSVFLGTQKGVALMRETGVKGSIVNMSSVAALVGVPACSAYAAAKGGVISFTKTVAAETAADGIRCNTLHPGLIDTNMQRQSSVDNPEEYVKLNAAVPMGYMGPPQTIADAALFLVSDLSTYMTGAQMVIDGGLINQ
jgi:NAD(P)-dependent dehydrogenase (short-subunit alcohol dehydrogenase family)